MPQMSPMNWIFLFLNVSLIFLLIKSSNYFILKYNHIPSKINIKFKKMNSKW